MSILKRTKNIIEAKVHKYEQCFKNPEEEIESALASISSIINDLERSAANSLAEIKITEKQIEELQGEQAKWLENAKRAVSAGQDDLARRALLQKQTIKEELSKSEDFLNQSEENYNYFKSELVLTKEKYQNLSSKLNLLKHNKLMEKAGVSTKGSNKEDEENLELQFAKLREKAENKVSVDEEFEQLKKKLKK